MIQWIVLPPFLANHAQPHLDFLIGTFFDLHCRSVCFLRLQEGWVAPDAIFYVLPGVESVRARVQAANAEDSSLIGCSRDEAIGEPSIFFFWHSDDGCVRNRMRIVHIFFFFDNNALNRSSLGAHNQFERCWARS